MAEQIFISYSAADRPVAEAVCAKLESAAVRCWMAPRDIVPGVQWGEAIIDAINASELLVLVFSAHANASRQVIREVERAVNRGIEVIPLRIEEVAPSRSLEFYISSAHWLDAFSPPLERHLDRLLDAVQRLLAKPERMEMETIAPSRATEPLVAAPGASPANGEASAKARVGSRLRWAAAVLVPGGAIAVVLLFVLNSGTPGVTALTISSPPAELFVGDTILLQANMTGEGVGNEVAVQWSSSDSAIVRSAGGNALFVAAGPGSAWLRAKAESVSDSVRVTVEAQAVASISIAQPGPLRVGDSLALRAVATDTRGRTIAAVQPRWASAAPRIAWVDSVHGMVRARAVGRTRITAQAGTTSASVDVTVELAASPRNGARETSGRPTEQETQPGAEGVTAPSEAALRALADSCIRALRARDSAWVAANYSPVTGTDLSNLAALYRLFRFAAYQLTDAPVLSPQVAAATVSFRARFTYRSSFGQQRTLNADFDVAAAPAGGGGARLTSCRVTGQLDL